MLRSIACANANSDGAGGNTSGTSDVDVLERLAHVSGFVFHAKDV